MEGLLSKGTTMFDPSAIENITAYERSLLGLPSGYVVKPKDTLFGIADEYGIDREKLAKSYRASGGNINVIKPGQVIEIPPHTRVDRSVPGLQNQHDLAAQERREVVDAIASKKVPSPADKVGGLLQKGVDFIKPALKAGYGLLKNLEPSRPGLGIGGKGSISLEQHKIQYPKLYKKSFERELDRMGNNLEKTAKAWHGGTDKQKNNYWDRVKNNNGGKAPTTKEKLFEAIKKTETGGLSDPYIYTKVLPKWSESENRWIVSSAFGPYQIVGGPQPGFVTAELEDRGLKYERKPNGWEWVTIDSGNLKKANENDPEYLDYLKDYQRDATEKITKTHQLLNKIPAEKRTDPAAVREALKQLELSSDTYKVLSQHPRPSLGLIGGGL